MQIRGHRSASSLIFHTTRFAKRGHTLVIELVIEMQKRSFSKIERTLKKAFSTTHSLAIAQNASGRNLVFVFKMKKKKSAQSDRSAAAALSSTASPARSTMRPALALK